MAALDDVFDIAKAFLDASVAALEFTPKGPPERAFVAPGQPALDCCDQLTVYTQTIHEVDVRTRTSAGALGALDQINRGGALTVTVVVQITRCIAPMKEKGGRLTPPAPDVQEADALMLDRDGWALWLGLSYALKHGELKDLCAGAERLGATKMTPEGDCGGWIFTYRYPIQGGLLGT